MIKFIDTVKKEDTKYVSFEEMELDVPYISKTGSIVVKITSNLVGFGAVLLLLNQKSFQVRIFSPSFPKDYEYTRYADSLEMIVK